MDGKARTARRAAFLRALTRSGNVRMAAAAAGGHVSAFYRRRKHDPAFARGWTAALAERARASQPPAALADDEAIWQGPDGKPRVIRIRSAKKWTPAKERAFLDHLFATCNVTGACAEIGLSTTAVYRQRKKCPALREAWDQVKEEGYARIELALIARALEAADAAGHCADAAAAERKTAAMTTAEMLNLLRLRRAAAKGRRAQPYGRQTRPRDLAEVRASILRKIAAIEQAGDAP